MAEIRRQQPKGAPGISFAEIHMPDDKDWGTGTFTTVFEPAALKKHKAIGSIMINPPRFQISATINANGRIPVLLGRADGSHAVDKKLFVLPKDFDVLPSHTLKIEFVKWRIVVAHLDDTPLTSTGADVEPVN